MSTRWHYESTDTSGIAPAFDAAWNSVVGALRGDLTPKPSTSLVTSSPLIHGGGTNPNNALWRQFISPHIGAGTISGTIKGQMQGQDTSAGGIGARFQMVMKVVSSDGSIVRGILVPASSAALSSAFTSTRTNRKLPLAASSPLTLTPVDAQNGDRIAIEVGFRVYSTNTVANLTGRCGHNGTDAPEDETTTTENDRWIEFSMDLPPYYPPLMDPLSSWGFVG